MLRTATTKVKRGYQSMLSKSGIKRRYYFGEKFIYLDYTHRLPDYQSSYPQYDRFLPHLVGYLPEGTTVIDVGANVGDSLAGMLDRREDLTYVAIEADTDFFEALAKNVAELKKQSPDASIQLIRSLVGESQEGMLLLDKGSTKRAVPGGGSEIGSTPCHSSES